MSDRWKHAHHTSCFDGCEKLEPRPDRVRRAIEFWNDDHDIDTLRAAAAAWLQVLCTACGGARYEHGYGPGDGVVPRQHVRLAVAAARADEREACAVIALECSADPQRQGMTARGIAQEIECLILSREVPQCRAEGVREGQRQVVDRELLRKVVWDAVCHDRHRQGRGGITDTEVDAIIDRVLAEHTQPAPAESEYQRGKADGVREAREVALRVFEVMEGHSCSDMIEAFDIFWAERSQDAAAQDEPHQWTPRRGRTAEWACETCGLDRAGHEVLTTAAQDERGEGEE